jgi:hypothetical protein
VERTGLVVQGRRARESIPERPKQVHSNCGRFVNQLQEGLAFNRIRVDMVQEKGRRNRLRNRPESIYDQVDVVQVPPFDRTTVGAELSSDRKPARQGASKAMGQDCSHSFSARRASSSCNRAANTPHGIARSSGTTHRVWLDAGQSVADSFAPVERFLADPTNRLPAGHFIEEKPGNLWTHQAAAEAWSWHRRHADKDNHPGDARRHVTKRQSAAE